MLSKYEKGFKPTEEYGFAREDYHPSAEADDKRELAAWAVPIDSNLSKKELH